MWESSTESSRFSFRWYLIHKITFASATAWCRIRAMSLWYNPMRMQSVRSLFCCDLSILSIFIRGDSISYKTSYRKVSKARDRSFEFFNCFEWNLSGVSAALFPGRPPNFEAIWTFHPIARLRDFAKCYNKTTYAILNRSLRDNFTCTGEVRQLWKTWVTRWHNSSKNWKYNNTIKHIKTVWTSYGMYLISGVLFAAPVWYFNKFGPA